MFSSEFVWLDLSTFDIGQAINFYSNIFGSNYNTIDNQYYTAQQNQKEIAGLYLMPEKFQQLNLPSFWMSYIKVKDLDASIAVAKSEGARVELVDKENVIGKIALIRDPLGAGFTIYEGSYLSPKSPTSKSTYIRSELVVSNISKVKEFYEKLFDWNFEKISNTHYEIHTNSTKNIAAVNEAPNYVKGKEEYWGVYFYVSNLQQTKALVLQNGGSITYDQGNAIICKDSFGAAFNITNRVY